MKYFFVYASVVLLLLGHSVVGQHRQTLGNATFSFLQDTLTVSTGKVQRQWVWTGQGLLTCSYRNLQSDKEWVTVSPQHAADWDLPTKIGAESTATLLSVNSIASDDERFTSPHLLVTSHITYDNGLEVQHLIRVYPDAPGLWTGLRVKADSSFSPDSIPADTSTYNYYGSRQPIKIARNEYVPVDFAQPNQRRYWGIYNDPGNRHNTRDMVREEIKRGWPLFWDEQMIWANGVSIESQGEGIILVKESNKTINKYGHQTGAFYCTPQGVEVTGWGLKPSEITSEFRETWPTWSMLFVGEKDEMELTLKYFDRIRYPVNLERDMHLIVDTWGTDFQNENYKKLYGRENAEFAVVEKEIPVAAALGMDIVRIDDGWQAGSTLSKGTWRPNPEVGYDTAWAKVKQLSAKHGVGIGLWAAIDYISPEELLTNQRTLGVQTWKLDFDKLGDWKKFHDRMHNVREFVKASGYATQVAWCPEYDDERYGWYSAAREYGPMYFQNVQNNMPKHLVYVPYITLRHHWTMAKFYNLNDLQCNWQNPALTNEKYSDAHQHSQSYAAMGAFAGAPTAFFLTQFLQSDEREELKEVIAHYKKHREAMFTSFVFPIGEEPNNASWTGFQFYHPSQKTGYLLVFRELHNQQADYDIPLRFLKNQAIELYDIEQGITTQTMVDQDGKVSLSIAQPADYLFLQYSIDD